MRIHANAELEFAAKLFVASGRGLPKEYALTRLERVTGLQGQLVPAIRAGDRWVLAVHLDGCAARYGVDRGTVVAAMCPRRTVEVAEWLRAHGEPREAGLLEAAWAARWGMPEHPSTRTRA